MCTTKGIRLPSSLAAAKTFRGSLPAGTKRSPSTAPHSYPLIRVSGAVQIDPLHFHGSIAGRDNSGPGTVLQAICEARHFLLLRRRKAADLVQDGRPMCKRIKIARRWRDKPWFFDDFRRSMTLQSHSKRAVNRFPVNCITGGHVGRGRQQTQPVNRRNRRVRKGKLGVRVEPWGLSAPPREAAFPTGEVSPNKYL